MALLPDINVVSKTLQALPKFSKIQRTPNRMKIVGFLGKKKDDFQEHPLQTTRRLAIGLASIALIGDSTKGISLAKDNGFWYEGPIPVPPVYNKIANEKTGTRSFLKIGLYVANIGSKGSEYRLRKTAFDLLSMPDLIKQDTLNYVRKYLRYKSTFMYYDFDKVISAASENEKQPLTDLANRLFDSFEKLEDAAKNKNLPRTESSYQDTTVILQEVMERFA
ncbi:hypothetical protein ACB094_06G048600 [Castanea mollissima]